MAKILLAEDSPTHSTLIRSVLEQDGHRVTCVADGCQAIREVEHSPPELLITDLRMPEMNGQELVQEIVKRFPEIPSIVVTARGSEGLAVDALALGAANFVPKNSLQMLLNHVVRQTLRIAQAEALYRNFSGRLRRPEFSFRLKNDLEAIEPAVLFVVQSITAAGKLNTTDRVRVGTALASSLFNAICYGNLEFSDEEGTLVSRLLSGDPTGEEDLNRRAQESPYRDRLVHLKVAVGSTDTRILVSHTGPGCLTRMTPAPGTPESFELEQCRGLMLMTSFMDDVIFHSGRTEVVMAKRYV
jgi:CheY-like chemotaxis protein